MVLALTVCGIVVALVVVGLFVFGLRRRLIQRSRGYAATVKRGEVVRENDESTGARPGRLLRGPQPLG